LATWLQDERRDISDFRVQTDQVYQDDVWTHGDRPQDAHEVYGSVLDQMVDRVDDTSRIRGILASRRDVRVSRIGVQPRTWCEEIRPSEIHVHKGPGHEYFFSDFPGELWESEHAEVIQANHHRMCIRQIRTYLMEGTQQASSYEPELGHLAIFRRGFAETYDDKKGGVEQLDKLCQLDLERRQVAFWPAGIMDHHLLRPAQSHGWRSILYDLGARTAHSFLAQFHDHHVDAVIGRSALSLTIFGISVDGGYLLNEMVPYQDMSAIMQYDQILGRVEGTWTGISYR
ncbi:MAG: hypothetical protein ACOCWQ_02135, partial [Nanoarchaeota archaeon]